MKTSELTIVADELASMALDYIGENGHKFADRNVAYLGVQHFILDKHNRRKIADLIKRYNKEMAKLR